MTSRMSAPSKLRTTASSVSTSRGAAASCAPQGRTQANRISTKLVAPTHLIFTPRLLVIIPGPPHHHRHHHRHHRRLFGHAPISGEFDAGAVAGAGYLGESRLRLGC